MANTRMIAKCAATALLGLLASSINARAPECETDVNGYRECTVSIDIDTLVAASPEAQRESLWCWAASLAMIYTMQGHPITQEEIVRQNFGALVNAPGGPFLQFEGRLNAEYVDSNGQRFRSYSRQIATVEDAARELQSVPLLYTTSTHATVQTEVSYLDNPAGRDKFLGGQIWDPSPGAGWRYLEGTDVATYRQAWAVRTRDAGTTVQSPRPAPGGVTRNPVVRPSAEKDRALNQLIDAINDLPVLQEIVKGKPGRKLTHRAQLLGDCVLELHTSRQDENGQRLWSTRQVIPLAGLTVDAKPLPYTASLKFRSTRLNIEADRSDMGTEKVDTAGLSFPNIDDARRIRDLAQAAVRVCTQE